MKLPGTIPQRQKVYARYSRTICRLRRARRRINPKQGEYDPFFCSEVHHHKPYLVANLVIIERLNRVGGGVTSAVLPHHRTYGSVYGGSRSPLETEPLIPQGQEFTAIKVGFGKSRVHV